MYKKSSYSYVGLGRTIQYLRWVDDTYRIHGQNFVLESLDRLFSQLNDSNLTITSKVANLQLDKIIYELKDIKETPNVERLGNERAEKLRDIIKIIEATLMAEMMDRYVFETSPKILDITKLIDTPENLFTVTSWAKLDSQARIDLASAAKCYAYETYTASAFHLMRTMEGVLKAFYKKKVKKNRISEPLMWGPMLNHMSTKHSKTCSHILSQMLSIKDNYRNPTQHPEKNYDADEIGNLWLVCIESINRMAKEL